MKVILLPLLFLYVIAWGQTTKNEITENKESNDGWQKLDRSNFSIRYPSSWELDETGRLGSSFFLWAPKESTKDKFQENIDLVIQSLNGQNIDLNKYSELAEKLIKTSVTNYQLIEKKLITSNTNAYVRIIYTCDRGAFHMTFEQYDYVISGKIYVLTFASEQSEFLGYKGLAEKIMNSFIIK